MNDEKFGLNGKEYIELNKILKYFNWVESGGIAHEVIDEGLVKVNGDVELRRRRKLRVGDEVVFEKYSALITE